MKSVGHNVSFITVSPGGTGSLTHCFSSNPIKSLKSFLDWNILNICLLLSPVTSSDLTVAAIISNSMTNQLIIKKWLLHFRSFYRSFETVPLFWGITKCPLLFYIIIIELWEAVLCCRGPVLLLDSLPHCPCESGARSWWQVDAHAIHTQHINTFIQFLFHSQHSKILVHPLHQFIA